MKKNWTRFVSRFGGGLVRASAGLPALAVDTISQAIVEFRHDGNSDYVWVTDAQPWITSGCGSTGAVYVWINPSLPGRKTMIATLMMARTTGAKVSFSGNCSNPGYSEAHYVTVSG